MAIMESDREREIAIKRMRIDYQKKMRDFSRLINEGRLNKIVDTSEKPKKREWQVVDRALCKSVMHSESDGGRFSKRVKQKFRIDLHDISPFVRKEVDKHKLLDALGKEYLKDAFERPYRSQCASQRESVGDLSEKSTAIQGILERVRDIEVDTAKDRKAIKQYY